MDGVRAPPRRIIKISDDMGVGPHQRRVEDLDLGTTPGGHRIHRNLQCGPGSRVRLLGAAVAVAVVIGTTLAGPTGTLTCAGGSVEKAFTNL